MTTDPHRSHWTPTTAAGAVVGVALLIAVPAGLVSWEVGSAGVAAIAVLWMAWYRRDEPSQAPQRRSDSPHDSTPAMNEVVTSRLSQAVLIVGRDGTIVSAGRGAEHLLGFTTRVLHGRRLMSLVHEDYIAEALRSLVRVADGAELHLPQRWRLRRADGSWLDAECTATRLADASPERSVVVAIREAPARELSSSDGGLRDPLTGLASRALFRDRAEHALIRAHRLQRPLAVLFLEFDDFRTTGLRATHAQRDALIVAAAARVVTCLRSSDSAGRLEGTRFALLLEDMADESNFVQVADRIGHVFAPPLSVDGQAFAGNANLGIASAMPEDSVDDVLRHADTALRAAKKRGRGACELFDARVHETPPIRPRLEDDLRRAIDAGELSLVYQPIVILRSRRIAGVEALVRWHHRTRGTIPATAFLAVAEESGLIVPLGRWMLREACAQAKKWQDTIGPDRSLTATVNVTARQLLDAEFVEDVASALRDSGIEPHRLVLEISEGALARSAADALHRLRQVRASGVRIAIDDYGSRSPSLGDPADIPVDILKIDRSYISQVTRRPEEHAATRAIVALGKLKRLRTVAEGVEREEQLAELLRFKCEYGQGALFSEPVSADGFLELLRRE